MYEPLFNDCFFCSCLFMHEPPGELRIGERHNWMTNIVDWLHTKRPQFNCVACGEYSITSSDMGDVARDIDMLIKIRHFLALRKVRGENNSSEKEPIILNNKLLSLIMKRSLLTPPEQMDNMIRFLAKSKMVRGYQDIGYRVYGALIGSNSPTEFKNVYHYLLDKRFINKIESVPIEGIDLVLRMSLMIEGWRYYQKLQKGETSNNRGFMAMKYGNKKLSNILKSEFKTAAEEAGFELFRLDEKLGAGLIDNQMLVEIQNSDFVVADLTDGNQGVYFEAGYAMGLGKPVIFTCEKSVWEKKKTHFDVNHYHTIKWEAVNPNKAAKELKFTIRATLPDKAKMSDDKK